MVDCLRDDRVRSYGSLTSIPESEIVRDRNGMDLPFWHLNLINERAESAWLMEVASGYS